MTIFALRFDQALIPDWANQFDPEEDAAVENEIIPRSGAGGILVKRNF